MTIFFCASSPAQSRDLPIRYDAEDQLAVGRRVTVDPVEARPDGLFDLKADDHYSRDKSGDCSVLSFAVVPHICHLDLSRATLAVDFLQLLLILIRAG